MQVRPAAEGAEDTGKGTKGRASGRRRLEPGEAPESRRLPWETDTPAVVERFEEERAGQTCTCPCAEAVGITVSTSSGWGGAERPNPNYMHPSPWAKFCISSRCLTVCQPRFEKQGIGEPIRVMQLGGVGGHDLPHTGGHMSPGKHPPACALRLSTFLPAVPRLTANSTVTRVIMSLRIRAK